MSPPVDLVQSDQELPERVRVVVIGGGIIGVATALFLAEKGHSVALCEKGRIGGEQSSRNWGWCRTMGRDFSEIPLAMESLRLWRGMNERTGRETGFPQRLVHVEIHVVEHYVQHILATMTAIDFNRRVSPVGQKLLFQPQRLPRQLLPAFWPGHKTDRYRIQEQPQHLLPIHRFRTRIRCQAAHHLTAPREGSQGIQVCCKQHALDRHPGLARKGHDPSRHLAREG